MPEKRAISRIRNFTPAGEGIARLLLTFEIPLSSAARDPLPRVARFICGLIALL